MEQIFAELEEMSVIKRTGEFQRDDSTRKPLYIAGDLDRGRIGEPTDFLQYLQEWWRAH